MKKGVKGRNANKRRRVHEPQTQREEEAQRDRSGGEKKEPILRGEEGETVCEGGRQLLLEQLVTAETT